MLSLHHRLGINKVRRQKNLRSDHAPILVHLHRTPMLSLHPRHTPATLYQNTLQRTNIAAHRRPGLLPLPPPRDMPAKQAVAPRVQACVVLGPEQVAARARLLRAAVEHMPARHRPPAVVGHDAVVARAVAGAPRTEHHATHSSVCAVDILWTWPAGLAGCV